MLLQTLGAISMAEFSLWDEWDDGRVRLPVLYGDGQEHAEVETNHEEERRGAPLSKIKDGKNRGRR